MPKRREPEPPRRRRAPNGAGTVFAKGNGYVARVTRPDGTRWERRAPDESTARAYLMAMLAEIDRDLAYGTPDQTLADYLEDWLEHEVAHRVRPQSVVRYRHALDRILPDLGHLPVRSITAQHLTRAESRARERYSPRSLSGAHVVLGQALTDAVRLGILDRSPLEYVRGPKLDSSPRRSIPRDDLTRILAHAGGGASERLWRVLHHTGLRIGEALALEWDDWDVRTMTLRVERTVAMLPGGVVTTNRAKTERGRRAVPVSPECAALLAEQRAEPRTVTRLDVQPIFAGPDGRRLLVSTQSKRFRRACVLAGVGPYTLHELRHTMATEWLAAGVPVSVVSARLGHSSPAITLGVYAHANEHQQRDAVELMRHKGAV